MPPPERVDNLTDELTSRIESLRVFVSEHTEATADATRSEFSIDAGRISGSADGSQGYDRSLSMHVQRWRRSGS